MGFLGDIFGDSTARNSKAKSKPVPESAEKAQAAFDGFMKSEFWEQIRFIQEAENMLDIMIYDPNGDPNYRCTCGVCWHCQNLRPDQQATLDELRKKLAALPPLEKKSLFPRSYDWGIATDWAHLDGRIDATSVQEAEKKLRAEYGTAATITIFF